jgi:hypothetical protein
MSDDESFIASLLSPSLFSCNYLAAANAAGCLETFFFFLRGLGIISSVSLPDVSSSPWPRVANLAFLRSDCMFFLIVIKSLCLCHNTKQDVSYSELILEDLQSVTLHMLHPYSV